MPDWYPLMRAARYIGVPGWVLAKQALVWQQWALAMQKAEDEADAARKANDL